MSDLRSIVLGETFLALDQIATTTFRDSTLIIFTCDANGKCTMEYQMPKGEHSLSYADMLSFKTAFQADRDVAIKDGVKFSTRRFEIHRHHPPSYIAGRRQELVSPEEATGFVSFCMPGDKSIFHQETFVVNIFELPNTTARMGTMVRDVCERYLMVAGEVLA